MRLPCTTALPPARTYSQPVWFLAAAWDRVACSASSDRRPPPCFARPLPIANSADDHPSGSRCGSDPGPVPAADRADLPRRWVRLLNQSHAGIYMFVSGGHVEFTLALV